MQPTITLLLPSIIITTSEQPHTTEMSLTQLVALITPTASPIVCQWSIWSIWLPVVASCVGNRTRIRACEPHVKRICAVNCTGLSVDVKLCTGTSALLDDSTTAGGSHIVLIVVVVLVSVLVLAVLGYAIVRWKRATLRPRRLSVIKQRYLSAGQKRGSVGLFSQASAKTFQSVTSTSNQPMLMMQQQHMNDLFPSHYPPTKVHNATVDDERRKTLRDNLVQRLTLPSTRRSIEQIRSNISIASALGNVEPRYK
ncbi:unnamed protein product [Didymodactylos carnosus]|uniref:Uncharacterized protein n=1 Tax=Didymodactylos carnosus TaxID=1234261 RepID=A0A814F8N6_9BILA|nr:unnamed protein product [Didymodactylos carnosus]CAF0979495.1 unnamed protein product [Didymodactylos carnosus]CAF3509669.1 unnamed protein product [Didymodactylos carnosus]CAF3752067.1 unnamed protein product [Didymodactylos carnosus]